MGKTKLRSRSERNIYETLRDQDFIIKHTIIRWVPGEWLDSKKWRQDRNRIPSVFPRSSQYCQALAKTILSFAWNDSRTYLARPQEIEPPRRNQPVFLSIAARLALIGGVSPRIVIVDIFPLLLSPFPRRETRSRESRGETIRSANVVISATNSNPRTLSMRSTSRLVCVPRAECFYSVSWIDWKDSSKEYRVRKGEVIGRSHAIER